MLSSVSLSQKERLDHIRLIIEELAKRIEAGPNVIADNAKKGATRHGQERYEQGYTGRRIAIEARLLHVVISRVLHKHLLTVDMSTCISDMMLVGRGLHEDFEEAIRAVRVIGLRLNEHPIVILGYGNGRTSSVQAARPPDGVCHPAPNQSAEC